MELVSIRSIRICGIGLILAMSLFFSVPIINGNPDTEILYCNSYTGDLQNWDELNPPSPYLADEDTGYIHEAKTSGATEGYFGFFDPSGSGTINTITLYIECYGDDTNDILEIWVDCSDGSGWVKEGTITVDQTSYGWETLDITRIDSWTDIQNAQIYFSYLGVAGGDDIYVRRSYLYIDFTSGVGDSYKAEVSQTIDWSGSAYRIGIMKRALSQSLTMVSDSLRRWDTCILVSQSLDLTSQGERYGMLTRFGIQNLYLTSNAFGNLITLFSRTVSVGINFVSNAYRSMIYKRFGNQVLSFVSNAFGKILGAGQNFMRTVSIQINLLAKSIQFTTIVNEFNAPLLVMLLSTLCFTMLYFLKNEEPAWLGFICAISWSMSAVAAIFTNASYWPFALFFSAIALVCFWLTISNIIEMRELDWL